MIPTYNCADHLARRSHSVLAQDPGPERMQIEVVDDAPPTTRGRGRRARRRARRASSASPATSGTSATSTPAWSAPAGDLVHLLHGDDCGPRRASTSGWSGRSRRAPRHRRGVLPLHRDRRATATGRGVAPLESARGGRARRLARDDRASASGCSRRAWRSAARPTSGSAGSTTASRTAEDWEMWARIAGAYAVWLRAAAARPLPGPRGHDQRPDAAQRRERRRPAPGDRDEPRALPRPAGRRRSAAGPADHRAHRAPPRPPQARGGRHRSRRERSFARRWRRAGRPGCSRGALVLQCCGSAAGSSSGCDAGDVAP